MIKNFAVEKKIKNFPHLKKHFNQKKTLLWQPSEICINNLSTMSKLKSRLSLNPCSRQNLVVLLKPTKNHGFQALHIFLTGLFSNSQHRPRRPRLWLCSHRWPKIVNNRTDLLKWVVRGLNYQAQFILLNQIQAVLGNRVQVGL